MNLELSEEQRLVQDALARVFREHSTGERVRRAEPLGFDPALWKLVCELGAPRLRVSEADGGSSLMHAMVAAEEAGRYLASVPLAEALVAHGLLSRLGIAPESLAQAGGDTLVATLALHDAGQQPEQLVPAGAVADLVLCLQDDSVFALSGPPPAAQDNLGSLPLARIDLAALPERRLLALGAQARTEFLRAVEEWRLLVAAMTAAAARKALSDAAAYACERSAFGRPIGSYQGLAHPLADAVTEVEGAQLLVWRAVHAIANGQADAAARIPLAAWWAATTGRNAALRSMRVFGGYGMTMEYDAQLYWRRIQAWSLQAGAPETLLRLGADRLHGTATSPLPVAGEVVIDFGFGAVAEAAAQHARDFCAQHHDDRMERFQYASPDGHQPAVWRGMAAAGLLYPDFPRGADGSAHDAIASMAIAYAIGEFGWYMAPVGVTGIAARMIQRFGSDAARRDVLPRLVRGEAFCSLGYSEPSAGSDIFAARTTATPHGDGWAINGQKMFTSQGHFADYCLLLARTGPDKYQGLTLFIVPLADQDGYRVSEVQTIGDDRTNVTFYEDVVVSDALRLGEVGGGVKVMAAALTMEQSGGYFYVNELRGLLRHALRWAQEPTGTEGSRPLDSAAVRRTLAMLATRLEVADVLSRRCTWSAATGRAHKAHGPMAKLFGSESWLACAEQLMDAAAPWSLLRGFSPLGEIEKRLRRAIPGTIYAGTSEIQRSLIAESALGLPRTRS